MCPSNASCWGLFSNLRLHVSRDHSQRLAVSLAVPVQGGQREPVGLAQAIPVPVHWHLQVQVQDCYPHEASA